MKRLISAALCAVMALSLPVAAFAAKPSDRSLKPAVAAPADASQSPEEPQPGYALQIDGEDAGVRACVMVPLRAVAEKLGFTVTWRGDGTILLDDGRMHTTVTLGEDRYQVVTSNPELVGMSAPFSLGMPPCVVNDTAYVPLGLFDALLGSQQGAVTMENGTIRLDTDPLGKDDEVQIPDPFAEYDALEQAAKAAGFELTAPEAVNGSDSRVFRAVKGDLLEVIYRKGEEETARVRKAMGSGDISGDYTAYPSTSTLLVDGSQVTLKGNGDRVSLAVWTRGGCTYALSVEGGMARGDMAALVGAIR